MSPATARIALGSPRVSSAGRTPRRRCGRLWKGLPDLHVEITDLQAGESSAIAHGAVHGTNLGRLYGAPATKKSYEASFFDWVRVEDGLIVERVQQSDVLGQMRQLYGKAFGLVGLGAMLLRL